jgi:tetratricopeptide (TPR) repeat protein
MLREFLAVKLEGYGEEGTTATYVAAMLAQAQRLCKQTMVPEDFRQADPLLGHWIDLTERQSEETFGREIGAIATNVSLYYYAKGIFQSGIHWCERALAISEKQLGPDHPDTGTSLNNLAGLYRSMGRYEAAEPLYLRALAIDSIALGEDHPDTAIDFVNLAGLYTQFARYPEAEGLYHKALRVFLDRLPQDHPYVEGTFNGLVNLIITAHTAGQSHQLSDHPMTQAILQQIQTAD